MANRGSDTSGAATARGASMARGASGTGRSRRVESAALVVRVVSVALAMLLLTTPAAGVAGGEIAGGNTEIAGGNAGDVASEVHDADDSADRDAPLTRCFVGDGYPLSIGNGSATIEAAVHLSVLTDPAAGDEFGIELAGTMDHEPIVTLAAGVRFDAPGLLATGVNPFEAFDLLYTYELRLPMFDGVVDDSAYREDRPPVGSAAGTVPC